MDYSIDGQNESQKINYASSPEVCDEEVRKRNCSIGLQCARSIIKH